MVLVFLHPYNLETSFLLSYNEYAFENKLYFKLTGIYRNPAFLVQMCLK